VPVGLDEELNGEEDRDFAVLLKAPEVSTPKLGEEKKEGADGNAIAQLYS
jgi:hypothetical protein